MSKIKWNPPIIYRRNGTDHINKGLPCQDYVDVLEQEDYTVMAMADGLSSLYNSHHASRAAVEGTIAWFRSNIDKIKRIEKSGDEDIAYIRQELIPVLRTRIEEVSYLGGMALDTMDCTLIFVLLVKPKMGDDFAYCGVLGDGAICIVSENPETGETDAGTLTGRSTVAAATDTIMSQDAQERMTICRMSIEAAKVFGFLVTTDGLDGEVYKKGSTMTYQALERYYNVQFLPNAREVLEQETDKLVKIPIFSDDISMGILSRDSAPRRFPDDPYWLCRCGYKNPLNTSTCIKCGNDYLSIYSQVNKDEYKNEADFFRKLNADPERQLRIIGMPHREAEELPGLVWNQTAPPPQNPVLTDFRDPDDMQPEEKPAQTSAKSRKNEEGHTISQPVQKDEQQAQTPKRRRSGVGKWVLLSAAAMFLLCFFTALNMYISASARAKSEAFIRELFMEQSMDPTEEMMRLTVKLEDGSIYVGAHKNGLPNGYGTVLRGETRESGQFINGEPDGLFLVVDLNDPLTYRVKVYDEKGVRELGPFAVPAPDADEKKVDHQTPLLREADVESEQIGILLPGETVYLTNRYEKIESDDGQVKLCQVHTAYGYVGWCNAEAFDNLYE